MADAQFLWPTPQGVYHFVADGAATPEKRLIRELLYQSAQCPLSYEEATLESFLEPMSGVEEGKALLKWLLKSSWLQLIEQPPSLPQEAHEVLLEQLITPLSDRRVLLLEEQGFYLAAKGFPHEMAEHLAALGADLIRVYERHRDLLEPMLKVRSQAWSLVDAGGLSRLGFWPLYIDNKRFGLVIEGVPMLNHPNFVLLVWQLLLRYGE